MKTTKRILALVLVLVMALALVACVQPNPGTTAKPNDGTTAGNDGTTAPQSNLPEYLKVGQFPLVEGEDITLKVALLCHDNTQEPKKTWQLKYIEEVVGVKLELVNVLYDATLAEGISLMMADGDLPDLMIGLGLNTVQLTQYGANDELLLDIAPYLNEENAPNILKVAAADPNYLKALTNDNGQVFSLNGWGERYEEAIGTYRMFYNWDIMKQAGITEAPETLDEFMTMLRTIKEKFPDMYPFGGNYARYNATYLIMNALGFNYSMSGEGANQRSHETDIGLRNGEVTLFSYDKEILPTYLETMHAIYTEGLMEPDYYTLEKDTCKAHLSAGMYAVFSEVPGLYGGAEFGTQWWGGKPLTSEFNDTPFWPNPYNYGIGNWCISAETEYPELCVALADLFFVESEQGYLLNRYPNVKQAEEYGLGITTGWHYDWDQNRAVFDDFEAVKDKYTDQNYWVFENLTLWKNGSFLVSYNSWAVDENGKSTLESLDMGIDDVNETAAKRFDIPRFDTGHNVQYPRALHNTWGKYITEEKTPQVCYFDADTTNRIADLKTLLDDYASQSLAEFITGRKEINDANLEAYFAEMKNLGAEEYIKIYADYWAAQNG